MRYIAALTLIALAACHSESNNTTVAVTANDAAANVAEPVNAAAPATNAAEVAVPPASQEAYLGKWIGPEGLVLEVTAKTGGGVAITNQWTLDDKGQFEGSVTAEGLRWMRGNTPVSAVLTDGDATGMKWIADKHRCLTVTAGSEAYCRD